MRAFAFTLFGIAAGLGIQLGLGELPDFGPGALKIMTGFLHLLLPMIATVGLAYAMRISNLGYVIFLAILSPFVSLGLFILFALFVLDAPML